MLNKIKCVRPGCKRWSKYVSPAFWCNKHWNLWWRYGVKGKKQPRWCTHRRDGSPRFSE